MRKKNRWILGLIALVASAPVLAIPVVQVKFDGDSVSVGNPVSADVSVVGLDDELVGAYDLTLSWDPALLTFDSLEFGPFLDGPDDSVRDFASGSGLLNVWEVSLSALLQQTGFGSMPLFTVNFLAVGAGSARLDFDLTALQILGDAFGEDYLGFGLEGDVISIVAPVSVPEPAPLSILCGGLLLLHMTMARRRSA